MLRLLLFCGSEMGLRKLLEETRLFLFVFYSLYKEGNLHNMLNLVVRVKEHWN